MKQIIQRPTQEAARTAWRLCSNGEQVFLRIKKLEGQLAGTHRILSSFPWRSVKLFYTTILIEELKGKIRKYTRTNFPSDRLIAVIEIRNFGDRSATKKWFHAPQGTGALF